MDAPVTGRHHGRPGDTPAGDHLVVPDDVHGCTVAHGVDAGALVGLDLEITESLIMQDLDANIAKLKAVRDMGVDIIIDDFGTGYSSLSYLAKLPGNTLKIDRSFIRDMESSREILTIVTTIISLAHSLGLKVVAEGIETESQQNTLRLLKCDEIQGYLVSHPLPCAQFEQWWNSHKI